MHMLVAILSHAGVSPAICERMEFTAVATKSMKQCPLVRFLQARFEYILCLHKGPKEELPLKLKTESMQGIMKQLASTKQICIDDGITLCNMVDDGPLPAAEATTVRSSIQEKVTSRVRLLMRLRGSPIDNRTCIWRITRVMRIGKCTPSGRQGRTMQNWFTCAT